MRLQSQFLSGGRPQTTSRCHGMPCPDNLSPQQTEILECNKGAACAVTTTGHADVNKLFNVRDRYTPAAHVPGMQLHWLSQVHPPSAGGR